MRRRFRVIWVPLIAVLLACPLLASTPLSGKHGATLQAIDVSAFPAARPSNPATRLLPTLKTRAPLDRQWTLWGVAHAAATLPQIFTGPLVLTTPSQRDTDPARRSARNFPPFPTGPPLEN